MSVLSAVQLLQINAIDVQSKMLPTTVYPNTYIDVLPELINIFVVDCFEKYSQSSVSFLMR